MQEIQQDLPRTVIFALVCLLGLATAATGVWAMYREMRPQELGASSLDRVLAMTDIAELPALSIMSQNNALLDCATALDGMQSLAMMYNAAEARADVAPKCLVMADHLAAQSPTSAYAWYVGAQASATLEDWSGFNHRLAMSWRAGPTEQWIGELRVALAEDNYSHLDTQTLAANDADLHMLVLSLRGVRTIASRYVTNPDFRERITAIVEVMPVESQQRFVANVRRSANGRARP